MLQGMRAVSSMSAGRSSGRILRLPQRTSPRQQVSGWQLSIAGSPTREDLIQGIIWDIFATDIGLALAEAENQPDPREAVRIAFEAAMRTASREGITFPVGMTLETARSFLGPVSQLIRRGQQEGLIRADLDPEKDTLRLLFMLLSVLPTFNQGSEGWNRYLRLVMDSLLQTPTAPLPPAEAVVDPFRHGK
jgi:hypothetical protein